MSPTTDTASTTDSTDSTTMDGNALQLRRDGLALDARNDPSLRNELAGVEAELARQQSEADRAEAADREAERRAKAEEIARLDRGRKAGEKRLREICARRVDNAKRLEGALDQLVGLLEQEFALAAECGGAATALGWSGPAYVQDGFAVRRVASRLARTSTRLLDFGRPVRFEEDALDATLGAAFRAHTPTKGA